MSSVREMDATFAVIAGLDPAIQQGADFIKVTAVSAVDFPRSLDRRVKPGNDGGAVVRACQANSGLNRTAMGSTRDIAGA